jgi:hypothetical protein
MPDFGISGPPGPAEPVGPPGPSGVAPLAHISDFELTNTSQLQILNAAAPNTFNNILLIGDLSSNLAASPSGNVTVTVAAVTINAQANIANAISMSSSAMLL